MLSSDLLFCCFAVVVWERVLCIYFSLHYILTFPDTKHTIESMNRGKKEGQISTNFAGEPGTL